MGRKKISNKNVNISISIRVDQKQFISEHPSFDFSKFSQIHLDDFINLTYDLEYLKEKYGGDKNGKKDETSR